MLGDIEYASFRVPALIARGWGMRERRLFARCLDLAAGYLSELDCSLDFARETGALPPDTCGQLDAQVGRARFYVVKLLLEIAAGPREGQG